MSIIHVDTALAAKLEGLAAREMRDFLSAAHADDPGSEAAELEVGGGLAVFIEHGSVLNQAFGLGFSGPVSEDEIAQVREFYESRDERAVVSVCPLADGSLLESLAARGFVADTFENVFIREVTDADTDLDAEPGTTPGLSITEVADDEGRALWAHLAATGFSAPLDPVPQQLALGRLVTRRPGARLLIAWIDGRPAGTAEVFIADDVAWMSADTTLPHFRGKGVQRALQRHRLALAAQAACTLAVTEAHPGSPSQRNMERLDFRLAYTRLDLIGPEPGYACTTTDERTHA